MRKYSLLISIILVISLFLLVIPSNSRADEILDFEEKLSSISEEEKIIIEELFIQLQEIEALERDYKAISKEIEELKEDVSDLEIKIELIEDEYNEKLILLEELLKSYQRMGPGSYLEIILESKDLSDFLRRINVIRDLARNTDSVLKATDEIKEGLIDEKDKLDEKLSLIEERQRNLRETLDNKSKLVQEQEDYLRSLESDREYYEMYLTSLEKMMVELEDMFYKLKKELPTIIANSYIPLESLNPRLSLQGIRLTISEELFNNILGNHDDLPSIDFDFSKESIIMNIQDHNIVLQGYFSIYEGHSIEFIIQEVKYHDFFLEEKTIRDLIGDSILFDFQAILEGSSIKDIKIFDGYMELIIDFKFF